MCPPPCGKPFRPYNRAEGYQKYCSEACRVRAWKQDHGKVTGRDALGRLPGVQDRDEGIELVRRAEFQEKAMGVIRGLVAGDEMTGEDIRLLCEGRGLEPHHHNAWGALIMGAVRMKLLSNTGRYVPMMVRRSHARRTPVYVVLGGDDAT